jgi:hypothetical protein
LRFKIQGKNRHHGGFQECSRLKPLWTNYAQKCYDLKRRQQGFVDLIKQAIDVEALKKNSSIGGNIVLMMHHFKKKYFC